MDTGRSTGWTVTTPEFSSGLFGWVVDPYGGLPQDLRPRTLLKIINPSVPGPHDSKLIAICNRRSRTWVIHPVCFQPVPIYTNPAGRIFLENHPRVIAWHQSEIRRLQQELGKPDADKDALRRRIDHHTWASTRRSPH